MADEDEPTAEPTPDPEPKPDPGPTAATEPSPEPDPAPDPEPKSNGGSGRDGPSGPSGPSGDGGADGPAGSNAGVPIDAWITAPLLAVARSNMVLAEATLEYVNRLAYIDPKDPSRGPRVLKFNIDRRYKKPHEDGFGSETLTIEAPVLALLPVPALLVDEVEIDFATSINQAVSQKKTSTSKSSDDGDKVKMHGQLSVQSDQSRQSDYRATYSFRLHAAQQPATEGMNMLADIMSSVMTPSTKDAPDKTPSTTEAEPTTPTTS